VIKRGGAAVIQKTVTEDNIADMLTKALPPEKLSFTITIVECYQFKVIAKPYMFCFSFIQVMKT